MGLVVWDHEAMASKYKEEMAKLLSLADKPYLLMIYQSAGDVACWEFNREGDPGEFVMVDINSRNKNRRKDVDYKQC